MLPSNLAGIHLRFIHSYQNFRLFLSPVVTRVLIFCQVVKDEITGLTQDELKKDFIFGTNKIYICVPKGEKSGISKNAQEICLSNSNFEILQVDQSVLKTHDFKNTSCLVPLGEGKSYFLIRDLISGAQIGKLILLIHDTKTFVIWYKLKCLLAKFGFRNASLTKIQLESSVVLVHSEETAYYLDAGTNLKKIRVISTGTPVLEPLYSHNIGAGSHIRIGTGGYWHLARDWYSTLELFKVLAERNPKWYFDWSGSISPILSIRMLEDWNSDKKRTDRLRINQHLASSDFSEFISVLHAFIYMRLDSSGETSGLITECTARGIPVFNFRRRPRVPIFARKILSRNELIEIAMEVERIISSYAQDHKLKESLIRSKQFSTSEFYSNEILTFFKN